MISIILNKELQAEKTGSRLLHSMLIKLIKGIQFNSPFRRYCFPHYTYNFSPPQLMFLCQCIEETRDVTGGIVEIKCAAGATTVFLNKHLDALGAEKSYVAIDTFSGFVSEDIDYEVKSRGVARNLYSGFQANSRKWFDWTMRHNGISRVTSFKADINSFDIRSLRPLSFTLLDVDLYRPITKALAELFEILEPGGIIVVDDCDSVNIRWMGAGQAYAEFMSEISQDARIVHVKLGVIRKPD